MKRVLFIIGLIVFAFLAGTLLIALLQAPVETAPAGYIEILAQGRAGEYGYSLYHANGTGNISLFALDEKPREKIVILSESGIGMESFDAFVAEMETLRDYNMEVEIVGSADVRKVRDAIIIVPTGAIPDYILNTIGSTGTFNTLIYIGKTDLKMASSLRKDYWYTQLSEADKGKIIVKEYTLDEFMDDKARVAQLRKEILENRWAVVSESSRPFVDYDGDNSLFVPLAENGYLRSVYTTSTQKGIENSALLPKEPVRMETDGDVYPWERAAVSFTLSNTSGKAFYTVEKDGKVLQGEELGRIGVEKAFYYTYEFEEPGDYIVKVYDSSGMLGSTYIHVRKVEIKLDEAWDIREVFSVNIDGEPLQSGKMKISINDGETKEYSIIGGTVSTTERLKSGENVFRVQYLEYKQDITYMRTQESTFEVYIKYGPFAVIVIVIVYVLATMRKRPIYILKIEKMARQDRRPMEVAPVQIVECMEKAQERFGWARVPITVAEIAYEARLDITDGSDIFDGDLEAILKKLEKKGLVERYGEHYQLSGWGDVRTNVLKRKVRDAIVMNGVEFTEKKDGFDIGSALVSTQYVETPKLLILAFEDEEDKRKFTKALSGDEHAMLELKRANGLVSLVTIEQLEEML